MNEHEADDLTTLDGIIHALYDCISGRADEERDARRFGSFFAPGARLIRTGGPLGGYGGAQAFVMDVEQYFAAAREYFKQAGFFELEIARRVDTFGHVTHAFSTYESRRTPEAEPFARGINSIQLFHDGARYFFVSIFWDFERPDNPIPRQYLPDGD